MKLSPVSLVSPNVGTNYDNTFAEGLQKTGKCKYILKEGK
jgi:hypothetical protein